MTTRKIILLGVVILAVVLMVARLGCGGDGEGTPTPTPTASYAEPTPTSTGEALFSDDFSDPRSGWETGDYEGGWADYEGGWLHIEDYTLDESCTYSDLYRYYSDVAVEVETKLVAGTDDNWHTIYCRCVDDNNYYDFGISADGYYEILLWSGGEQIDLTGEPTLSSHIRQGWDVTNVMRAECDGNTLRLYANGHLLAEVTDDTFSRGFIGLGVTSLAGSYSEVAFDNIVVTGISAAVVTATPEVTPAPTLPPTVEPTSTGGVLFSDDFSNPSSGWETGDYEGGWAEYQMGALHIEDSTYDDACTYSDLYRYYSDLAIEVETWLVAGTDDNWQQVFCRCVDDDNYYNFGISADGYYAISVWKNGVRSALSGSPTLSSYINEGWDEVNLMRVECEGNTLRLYANGHLLSEVTDSTFSNGYVGLGVTSLAGSYSEVAFDNFVITAP